MNYMKIKYPDVANGPGVRVSLFVSGCFQRCPGCFNPETWDPRAGKPYTQETEAELLRHLSWPEVSGLSILGGEPMLLTHLPLLAKLVWRAKRSFPEKSIWVWTGYEYEAVSAFLRHPATERRLRDMQDQLNVILTMADCLVDGPYIEAEKDLTLLFRGSRNQRIIDLQGTKEKGEVVLWQG